MLGAFDTARLHFRPLAETDRALYCESYGDQDTMRYIGSALPLAQASRQFDSLLRASQFTLQTPAGVTWAMWVVSTHDAAATVGMFSVRIADMQADMGALLHREWRGKGIVTDAVAAMVERLFASDGISRVTASHRADNAAAHGVLFKTGFMPMSMDDGFVRWSIARPA